MKNDDTRDLKKFIKDELRAIKDMVEITKRQVNNQELYLRTTSRIVSTIQEQQSLMNEKIDDLVKKVDEHTDLLENQIRPSVIITETTIKSYADMYKVNNSNGKKLEKRIEVLEDQSGIIPPPELTLVNTQ